MAGSKKFAIVAVIVAVLAILILALPNLAAHRQSNKGRDGIVAPGPLISRGYTEAPAGTVVVAGNPEEGGSVLLELRITDGQKVAKGDIIAVLSNYPTADVQVHEAEAGLAKTEQQRDAMVSGYRASQIAMQEIEVSTAQEETKLKTIQLQRTDGPPDQKQLEVNISQQKLEQQKAKLRVMKETLATDLAQTETEITIKQTKLDDALVTREESLVRAPLSGIVVQIFTRQGERVSGNGIAKIVDLSQMRVITDIDDLHFSRVALGGKVEVTFRGNSRIYTGKISRIVPVVRRLKRSQADMGEGNVNLVEIEIELDETTGIPQVLTREARVTFL
jgi:multidrug resistance efflux pump